MNDRPMRNLSLRKFRDQIADLTAPVEVSLRDGDGNIRILGYWTPYAQIPPDATPLESLTRLDDQPPLPGQTTAIRDGAYVREDRAPGPPNPDEIRPGVPRVSPLREGIEVPEGGTATLEIPVDDAEFPVGEESEFDRHPRTAPKIIHTPEEAATVVPFNPVRAVPKPSQRRRRR